MFMKKGKFDPAWLLAIIIPAMFIFAITVFLKTEDCYKNYCITGWDVLKLEGASFWLFAIGGLIFGAGLSYLAYANESGSGAIGRKMRGDTSLTIVLVILALGVICGPWGKACTDKGNGGVTAPNYKAPVKP